MGWLKNYESIFLLFEETNRCKLVKLVSNKQTKNLHHQTPVQSIAVNVQLLPYP